jgi:hypothetical protein
MASITLLMVQPMEKSIQYLLDRKMYGPQSQPGQSSEEKTPSSAGNQTQVTILSQ